MAQNVSLAVASGEPAFERIPIAQGRVLFLALEGSKNGMQKRLDNMLQGNDAPEDLHFVREFPKIGSGALDKLQETVEYHSDIRLIVVDTCQAIRGLQPNKSGYKVDYETLKPLAEFAETTGVSVLAIHHAHKRKAEFEDGVDPGQTSSQNLRRERWCASKSTGFRPGSQLDRYLQVSTSAIRSLCGLLVLMRSYSSRGPIQYQSMRSPSRSQRARYER